MTFEDIQGELDLYQGPDKSPFKKAQFVNMIHCALKTRHLIAFDVKLCAKLPIESGMFILLI